MQVVYSERVKTALHVLGPDDRRRVQAWLDYFQNWETDDFVRSRSVLLKVRGQSVYMFRTTTDIRIFYTVDQQSKTISVIDVATEETIRASGSVPTGAT